MGEHSQVQFHHNIYCIIRVLFAQEVTPQNFLNILQGNAEAVSGVGSGKVLRRWGSQYIIVNVKCLKLCHFHVAVAQMIMFL